MALTPEEVKQQRIAVVYAMRLEAEIDKLLVEEYHGIHLDIDLKIPYDIPPADIATTLIPIYQKAGWDVESRIRFNWTDDGRDVIQLRFTEAVPSAKAEAFGKG